MAFDRARYLEHIQNKYGSQQNIINDNANTITNNGRPYSYQKGGLLKTINSTLAEFSYDANKGFLGSVEGIIDLGASAVGLVGGLIDKDFKDAVSDFVSHDYTEDIYNNVLQYMEIHQWINRALEGDMNADAREYSAYQYLGETGQNIAHGVGEAGGQFLFAYATSGIGSALGLGAKAMQALQTASIFTSASGKGIQGGLNEGLGLEKATVYGLAQGAIEATTERLVGGAVGKLTGQTGVLDKGVGKIVSKIAKGNTTGSVLLQQALKLGFDAVGEGFEEVASEILDQKVVRPLMGLESDLTASDLGESFLIGMISGAVLNGVVETGSMRKGKTYYATKVLTDEMQSNYVGAINKIKNIENRFKLNIQQFADEKSLEQAKQKAIDEVMTETLEKQDNLMKQYNKVVEESLNTENNVYNENTNTKEIINDTRGIEEGSIGNERQRMGEIDTQRYGEESTRLREVFKNETSSNGNSYRLVKGKSGNSYFTNIDGETFYKLFKEIHSKQDKATQIIVDVHDEDFYNKKNGKAFVREDALGVGFVEKNGNIVSALNANKDVKGLISDFLTFAIDNGGRYMDCMNSVGKGQVNLPYLYSKYGFKPVAKIKYDRNIMLEDHPVEDVDFYENKFGQSDLIFMAYTGETKKIYSDFDEIQNEINKLEYVDWDTAVELRDKYLQEQHFNEKVEKQQKDIDTKMYKVAQSYYDVKKYHKSDIENIYKTTRDFANYYLGKDITKGASESNIDKTYNKIKKATLNETIDESNIDVVSKIFIDDILSDLKVDDWSLEDYLEDYEYDKIVEALEYDVRNMFLNRGDTLGVVKDLKENIINLKDKIKEQKSKYANLKDKARALIQLERTEKSTKRKADIRKNNRVGANIPPYFAEAYKTLFNKGNLVSSTKVDVPARDKKIRERVKEYRDNFYNEEKLSDLGINFNEEIATMIDDIVEGTDKNLSTQEILNLRKIIRNLNGLVDRYNKVRVEGKMIPIREIATKQETEINDILGDKSSQWGVEKKGIKMWFRRMNRFFSTPYYVFQSFDLGNPNGAFSKMLIEKINKGEIRKDEMLKRLIEFKNVNFDQKYISSLKNEVKITIKDKEYTIDKGTLLSLYTGLQREWAMEHYKTTGIIEFEDLKGVRHKIEGFDDNILQTLVDQKVITEKDIQASKDLIKMYKIMSEYKEFTDIQISGFSNVEKEGVYYPIQTRSSARPQNVDSSMQSMMKNLIRGFGFNKTTLSSKGSLFFENCFETLNSYITNMGRYVAYAEAIDSTNRYLNTNISNDSNDPKYMKDVYLEKVDYKMMEYLTDYFQDIQGLKTGKREFAWLSKIRSNFSKAVLYANPKVVIQQLSAIPSFLTHTSMPNLSKAVAKVMVNPFKAIKTMKENSPSAFIRYDGDAIVDAMVNSNGTNKNAIVKAIDKIGGGGISFMDSLALAIGYQACIYQENGDITKGLERFEDAVRTSQPSTSISSMNQARRGSELSKTISMFTSQTQQNTTMMLSALQEVQYANRMLKLAKENKLTNADIQTYEDMKKRATKKLKKFSTAYFAQATMVTLIAMAIQYAMGAYEDEEDKLFTIFGKGFIENTIGSWNPLTNAVINQLVNKGKYDFQLNTFTAINEMFDSMNGIREIGAKVIAKEYIKSSDITDILLGVSKIMGIPSANVIKYSNWVMSWFSPETALKMNNALYGASASDATDTLKKYIKSGKDNTAKTELKYIMTTYKTGATSDYTNDELYRLYKGGYDVLPNSLNKKLMINEDEYNMNNKANKTKFMSIYSKANYAVEELLKSSQYKSLSDSGKAKSIKRIYDAYYNSSKSLLTNGNFVLDRKFDKVANLLLNKGNGANTISKLSSHLSRIEEMKDDAKSSRKEKVQKYINSLSLSKNEKYLLYYLAGYSLSDEQKSLVESYLKNKGANSTFIKEFF